MEILQLRFIPSLCNPLYDYGDYLYQHFMIFELQKRCKRKEKSLNKYAKCESKLKNQLAK